MKKYLNTLFVFISLLLIDLIFYLISFEKLRFIALLRMILINGALAFLCTLFTSKTKKRLNTIICFILIFLFGVYAYIQLGLKNMLETYYSFKAVADGGFRVSEFVGYFIKSTKWTYYLEFLPAILYLILRRYFNDDYKISIKMIAVPIICASLLLLSLINSEGPLKEAIKGQDNLDVIVSHTGVNTFLFEDISSLFISHENNLVIENAEEEMIEEEIPKEISLKRTFDDTRWLNDIDEENDDTLKTIDNYLISRPIENKNDMTGHYEGYNFIYFLVESLDYMGIDKELTPTIWKMMNDGYYFSNHYTPVFTCGTGDSEFASMTSLMPYGSNCTVYSVTHNNLSNSIATLFKNKGYSTYEFHNWDDTFYKRSELSKAYGVDVYKDIDDLDFDIVYGWQSDSILAEKTMDYYINDDNFFVYYVTSTMHWPYNEDSYYGNHYLDRINEVHPDYPLEVKRYISKTMEFDKMLETLIDGLKKADKLDKTVFCFWPDHHPFNISVDYVKRYTNIIDRYQPYGFYMSPFIIYCANDKGETNTSICSTFDHLPTVANLFNLNYDPRLYVGNDIFNDNCRVILTNGDWINNDGIYIYASDEFINFNNSETSKEKIDKITTEVRNTVKVSRAMVSTDYFNKRSYLVNPINIEE